MPRLSIGLVNLLDYSFMIWLFHVALQVVFVVFQAVYFLFKCDESSFVSFGCVDIFINFEVLSLFCLVGLWFFKGLFVLGIDV